MNGQTGRPPSGRPNGVRLRSKHQADVRLKIKVVQLINRLQSNGLGILKNPRTGDLMELTMGQIRSIEILLRKVLPDMAIIYTEPPIPIETLSDAELDARIQTYEAIERAKAGLPATADGTAAQGSAP